MAALKHIGRIIIGYLLAALAAGLLIGVIAGLGFVGAADGLAAGLLAGSWLVPIFVVFLTLPVTAIVIVVAETLALRHWAIYLLAGIMMILPRLMSHSASLFEDLANPDSLLRGAGPTLIAAGAGAGLIYWAVAGRHAGALWSLRVPWKRQPSTAGD